MASQGTYLMAQFLDWVERSPRTYADVRDVWPSTCPLNSAWEDAVVQRFVAFNGDGTLVLTEDGRAELRRGR
ncbi:MAG TPA: hypothetical protein VL966_15570 [Alphaproteobacteria bacterium]|nr:hypothetical protein [Alphaproteobacteria bacterium]